MAELIRNLRKERGLTLEEVGKRVGVGKSTVRKWENGQIANMRRDKIALLAKALGVTPTYLMGWPDEDSSEKNNPAPDSDSPERNGIATLYLSLNEENQKRLLDYAQVLLRAQQAERDSQG